MHLEPGKRLGPYEIFGLIGSGGMGEVYKARDTRLDRTVAIKVLSARLNSIGARERFEREARAVSMLNHPHICALYDVGSQEGVEYLVMEYLEGETMGARLARGSMPLDKVYEYGTEIAEALDQAHRHGVIHRDLKPGNVMITKSGAKLLDFGLAKTAEVPQTSTETIGGGQPATKTLTNEGSILGTCQYLAPELLSGKEADARSDIFAFGAMLYEMVTGHRAFPGKTQAVIIAAILEHEPASIAGGKSASGQILPPTLDHLILTCLSKDPEQRRQTAHDVLLELKWIAEGGSQAGIAGPGLSLKAQGWRSRGTIAGAALLVAALAGGALYYAQKTHEDGRVLRVSVLAPEKAPFVASSLPAVSPDGKRVIFTAGTGPGRQLYVRDLDLLATKPLPGTEGADDPFWSPDNRSIGFFARGKLKRVELAGGPAVSLCDAVQGRGGSWSRDGVIVFAPDTSGPLNRVQATGGSASPVTTLDASRSEVSHRFPWFLPDGRHFLYTGRSTDATKNAIYVGDLQSNEKRKLRDVSSNGAYSPPGYLLWVRERTLMAEVFNAGSMQTSGDPFPVAEPVELITANVQGSFAVSQNGILAYFSGGAGLNSTVTWFDRNGKAVGNVGTPGTFLMPSISPDGNAVAVDRLDSQAGTYDIWLHDLARNTASRLTFDPKHDDHPVWAPDGNRLVFSSNRNGHYDLFLKSVSNGSNAELLVESQLNKFPNDWSRDGRYIIYYVVDPKTKYDIWVAPLPGAEGAKKPFPYLQTEFSESWPKFSPDGKWVVYTSDESKQSEVYVQSFPTPGNKWKVSVDGGSRAVWSRDGKEIFYLSLDKKLMAAPVLPGEVLRTGTPKPLFDTRIAVTRLYDASPDGRRFLIVNPVDEAAAPPITVVVNWTSGIRK
jgi:eukaryotic-like serine/threonine-protein kinase